VGDEPIPGYRLVERLGQGGFGEVWKCEVSGGLLKAIKFIDGDLHQSNDLVRQELAALYQIKEVRHPFLLSLERVEVLNGELLVVMELADRTLHHLMLERQAEGLPGIPRDELLPFLHEVADALDAMNLGHGLQHLDIKPQNLVLVGYYVKVADFGLVQSWRELAAGEARHLCVTPRYAAPEVLQDRPSPQSDQYSLALVYHELLTGTFPFTATNVNQLMMDQVNATPDLSALPPGDQPIVARALAKDPNARFGSCMDFIEALQANSRAHATAVEKTTRRPRTRPQPLTAKESRASDTPMPFREISGADQPANGTVLPATLPLVAHWGVLAGDTSALDHPCPTAGQLLAEVLQRGGYGIEEGPSHCQRYLLRYGNTLEARFAVRSLPANLDNKIDGFCRHWQAILHHRELELIVLRVYDSQGLLQRYVGPQRGLEVQVQIPAKLKAANRTHELLIRVQPFGRNPAKGIELLLNRGPLLLESLRAFLNASDKRARGRLSFARLIRVFPVLPDQKVGRLLDGQGKNISFGGIAFFVKESLPANRIYLSLATAPGLPYALLSRVERVRPTADGSYEVGASFLVDESWCGLPDGIHSAR
jgi:hypothetical protein